MKFIGKFLVLGAAFVGVVGGFGYALYYKEFHIALGLASAAWLLYPQYKAFAKEY